MKCINRSHPSYKDLLKKSEGVIDSFTLEIKVSKWQELNNTDEFPTVEQLGLSNVKEGETSSLLTNDKLMSKLKGFMQANGINLTSLEDYFNVHKKRFEGLDRNALVNGLADIQRKVIAVRDNNDLSVLTEENVHMAVAYMKDHSSYKRALRLVADTVEYKESVEEYTKVYTEMYPDKTKEQIKELVKMEVLGQIGTNSILNDIKTTGYSRLIQSIKTMIKNFFKLFTNNSALSDLDLFVNDVKGAVLNNKVLTGKNTTDDLFFNAKLVNLKDRIDSERTLLKTRLDKLQKQIDFHRGAKKGDKASRDSNIQSKLDKKKERYSKLEKLYDHALHTEGLIQLVEYYIQDLSAVVKAKNNNRDFTYKEINDMRDFVYYYLDDLTTINNNSDVLNLDKDLKKIVRKGLTMLNQEVMPFFNKLSKEKTVELENENNLDESYNPEDNLDNVIYDTSIGSFFFGSLYASKKHVHRIVDSIIVKAKNLAHKATILEAQSFLKDLGDIPKDLYKKISEYEDGKRTGYFIQEFRHRKFKGNLNEFAKTMHSKYHLPDESEYTDREDRRVVKKNRLRIKEGWKDAYDLHDVKLGELVKAANMNMYGVGKLPVDLIRKFIDVKLKELNSKLKKGDKPYTKNYVAQMTYNDFLQSGLKKDLTTTEKMALNNYNYRQEYAKWFAENTMVKPYVSKFKYDGFTGLFALDKKNSKEMGKEAYEEWKHRNILIGKDGTMRAKGNLVTPSDGSTRNYKGKTLKTVDYTNYAYNNLDARSKELLTKILSFKQGITDDTDTDLYLMPQITKSKLEYWKTNTGLKNKLSAIKQDELESITEQEDDTEFGNHKLFIERPDGTKKKPVPIYYDSLLENVEARLTTDVVGSLLAMNQMKNNFKETVKVVPELEVLLYSYGQKKVITKTESKLGTSSNLYKSLDLNMNRMLYGESRQLSTIEVLGTEVNTSKAIDNVNNYFRKTNLAFNPFTIITGYLSGTLQGKLENVIARYTDKKSSKLANKYFAKHISGAASEWGKPLKNNDLNKILEYLGVAEPNLKNLDKERLTRAAIKSGLYFGYSQADYVMKGKLAISLLYKNDLMSKWNGTKFDISDGEYNKIMNQIQLLSNRVDGQLSTQDKAAIHFYSLSAPIMTHRNWIIQKYQDRFKSKGVNYRTEEMEEGFYNTGWRFIFDYAKDIYMSDERLNSIKSLALRYNELEHHEKIALQRLMYEQALVVVLITLASLMNSLAEDDDNYFLDSMALLSNRVLLETASFVPLVVAPTVNTDGIGLAAGAPIVTEITANLTSPYIFTRQIDAMADFTDFFSLEDVKSGKFKGYSKLSRNMINFLPAVKGLHSLRDPNSSNNFLKMKSLSYVY